MDFFSGGKPNLIGSDIQNELNNIEAPEIKTNIIANAFRNLYNDYIRDYKLPIFFLILMGLFLVYRYKETQKRKKQENFMKDKYNVPPFNQFIPYQYQENTMPIKMNPSIDPKRGPLYNADLDTTKSEYNRTYYHGTDKYKKRETDLCHPYNWEGNFNNVDDYFINYMAGENNKNVNNYNNLVDTKNYNLSNFAHM